MELYKYLSAITPMLCYTINKNGSVFFNVFSINPPILIFAPVRRIRNNTSKDTLENVKQIKECVISIVTENIDQQVSLSSCDYDVDINEFEKAGFTELKSDIIKPSRIKESPINFECKVNKIIDLGTEGGSGSLVLCEVLKMHINKSILNEFNEIDPFKLNVVSRLGANWYGKTTKDSLYEIAKPISKKGMGFDNLPLHIRNSKILTGNELAILASREGVPEKSEINNNLSIDEKHLKAKKYLSKGKYEEAWQILI